MVYWKKYNCLYVLVKIFAQQFNNCCPNFGVASAPFVLLVNLLNLRLLFLSET